ncbi:MAG TPA: UDP-N-acetylmuramoyl-tripeptide--D-alanyl-D-alanine ligase [Kiritimatiellia bacterium]|nr:UDP-N-acetylmuramoyl-tripeptide--D-alanyl-D-alanine ligase [Kiritimatiellia bacterium]
MITLSPLRTRIQQAWRHILFRLLRIHARFLRPATVIAITGSCGKTTAKDLTHHILSTRYPGTKSPGTFNGFYTIAATLLKTIPFRHRFVVLEFGAGEPGRIDLFSRAALPHIGIVLTIGRDHHKTFRTRQAVANEKQPILQHLPPQGLAILNTDDELIPPMAHITSAPVLTFGTQPHAQLRAENIHFAWPQPLTFDLIHQNQRIPIQTTFPSDLFLPSILASAAVALHLGMTPHQISRAISTFPGSYQRMTSVTLPDTSTFILDDWKAPFWSIPHALRIFQDARAPRKILVLGTISDSSNSRSKTYHQVIQKALPLIDYILITGPHSHEIQSLHQTLPPDRVHIIPDLQQAADQLDQWILPGSLILLKGTNRQDHLQRLMHHRLRTITCWDSSCRLPIPCRNCPQLYRPPSN